MFLWGSGFKRGWLKEAMIKGGSRIWAGINEASLLSSWGLLIGPGPHSSGLHRSPCPSTGQCLALVRPA